MFHMSNRLEQFCFDGVKNSATYPQYGICNADRYGNSNPFCVVCIKLPSLRYEITLKG